MTAFQAFFCALIFSSATKLGRQKQFSSAREKKTKNHSYQPLPEEAVYWCPQASSRKDFHMIYGLIQKWPKKLDRCHAMNPRRELF